MRALDSQLPFLHSLVCRVQEQSAIDAIPDRVEKEQNSGKQLPSDQMTLGSRTTTLSAMP